MVCTIADALAIYGLDIFLHISSIVFSIELQIYVLSVPVRNCLYSCWQLFCLVPFFCKTKCNIARPSTVACSNFTIGSVAT